MKNINDLFSYIESFTNLEKTRAFSKRHYRLDRMYMLLKLFGNPHLSYKTIHVAGTKGKGSTAAFIASALTAHGVKTGLYTSPHVSSYCERINVDRMFPEPEILLKIGKKIKEKVEGLPSLSPTTFELLTLLAFCYFRETVCDYVVAEVGIGGRLDATNVVMPLASVITPIDIEHTDVLGNTIEEIASEKAGIIKQGVPVFSGYQQEQVKKVLTRISAERNTHITFLDDVLDKYEMYEREKKPERSGKQYAPGNQCYNFKVNLSGRMKSDFNLHTLDQKEISFPLSMPGDFQAENAGLAFITFISIFPGISLSKIKTGFENTKLPGRFEIVQDKPVIVLDGAHTPLAIKRIFSSFRRLFMGNDSPDIIAHGKTIPGESFPGEGILLFGSVKGKDHEKMAEILAHGFKSIIISTPGYFKESDPVAVYRAFKTKNKQTFLEKNPEKAFKKAQFESGGKLPILVTGSFYMIAEIRKLLI